MVDLEGEGFHFSRSCGYSVTEGSLAWRQYFDAKEIVEIGSNKFNVYTAGTTGPVCVLVHGATYSALSWCMLSRLLKRSCRVVAIDLRGHGETVTEGPLDLSLSTLSGDVVSIVQTLLPRYPPSPAPSSSALDSRLARIQAFRPAKTHADVLLLGHSLGGCVVAHAAHRLSGVVSGLVVIDSLEEAARIGLPGLAAFAQTIPDSFATPQEAVDWTLAMCMISNRESANISVPAQLVKSGERWKWRCSMKTTEPWWNDWFENLTTNTLTAPTSVRILIVASMDRLGNDLTVAHMQGKFKLVVAGGGHAVNEDAPESIAHELIQVIEKHGFR